MDKETYRKNKRFAGEKKPSMKRRLVGHDYTRRGIYLLTMAVEGRRPLFGRVYGSSDDAFQLTLKVFVNEGIDWQRAFIEEPIEVMTDLMGPHRMRKILKEVQKKLKAMDD